LNRLYAALQSSSFNNQPVVNQTTTISPWMGNI
jgi:hypothetical protein